MPRAARQIPLSAPVGVHDVEVRVAVARAPEGDGAPVRDQAGSASSAGLRVRFRCPLPLAFMT